jgi:hypothetical protein
MREGRTFRAAAAAWGYVSEAEAQQVLAALDPLGGRVFGLARR